MSDEKVVPFRDPHRKRIPNSGPSPEALLASELRKLAAQVEAGEIVAMVAIVQRSPSTATPVLALMPKASPSLCYMAIDRLKEALSRMVEEEP